MRAVILADGKLVIKDVPKPSPGHEEALVKITAAGICHSDLHLVKGDWPGFIPLFPIPMGHEGIGIVEELGPWREGARGRGKIPLNPPFSKGEKDGDPFPGERDRSG